MMLIIAFFAEINLLSKTINVSLLIKTFLAFNFFSVLELLSTASELNQIVRKCLKLFKYTETIVVDLFIGLLLFINNRIEALWWTE
jgi:hypothetical protein